MVRPLGEQGQAPRTIAAARVRAILKRGMIWDESEFVLLRGMLPTLQSDAEAIRIKALLHAFEHGESEDAA